VTDVLSDHNRLGLAETLPAGSKPWVRILGLNSVTHVVTQVPLPLPLISVSGSHDTRIYELSGAVPRAYVARRVRLARAPKTPADLMQADDFEPGRDVAFSEGQSGGLVAGPIGNGAAESPSAATITEDRQNHVAIDVDTPDGGVLVLTDAYFPEWQATLDGRSVGILQANHSQRGVIVPPGHHQVRFDLEWRSLSLAAKVAATCAAMLLGLWWKPALLLPRLRPL
jgi:hypothetical protein